MDAHYRSFEKLVLPRAGAAAASACSGMKSMANGIILKSRTVTPIECLHYALNLPTSVVITGIDSMEILDQALEAARTFRPLTRGGGPGAAGEDRGRRRRDGEFELFKTISIFDSHRRAPGVAGRGARAPPAADARLTEDPAPRRGAVARARLGRPA